MGFMHAKKTTFRWQGSFVTIGLELASSALGVASLAYVKS
jgi:hypothetical protein